MRLLRRNALGVYAVYAAAIASGLVVTPIVIHSIGKSAFGVWTFIGALTIYLSVLDFGVGPSIVRFGAEARGRGASDELNSIASTGLAMYAAIGLVTLPIGVAVAWLVPWASGAPHHLYWDARVATLLVVVSLAARFPLGLFNNLLVAQQRWDLQNLANFVSTTLYAVLVGVLMPFYGGLVLLGALTLGTTLLRLLLPLLWLRRELPGLRVRRRFVSRARLRELTAFSWSNFLVHVAQKIVFSTDVIVVAIVLGSAATGDYGPPAKLFALAFGLGTAVTSLMFPAFAELEGAGAADRQRRLLLSGLRGGTALMLLLALPLLLIPDLLIHAWIGGGFHASYAVMAILAGVLLVHQPIYVLTQFLIARGLQREVARVSIATTAVNLALSFVLAATWGIWGVALSTLVTDLAALLWIVPRLAAPAATTTTLTLVRAVAQPLLAASGASVAVLVGVARVWKPETLPMLAVLGLLWVLVAGGAIWWFGLASAERASLVEQLRPRSPVQSPPEPGGI
jgi:O-antigen/teichoic acid export membrane protein